MANHTLKRDQNQVPFNTYPIADTISERVSDTTGTSTDFTTFGATAGFRNFVTAISVCNTSATDGHINFRDGAAGSILWTVPVPAGGGAVLSTNGFFFKTSAGSALAYDVSAALSTVIISISGFKSDQI